MYLPDCQIEAAIEFGRLRIDPYEPANVQPASIDLRLGRRFLVLHQDAGAAALDPQLSSVNQWRRVELPPTGSSFLIRPGEFVLASTYERVTMPDDLLGRLEGKSSIGRLGVRVHSTAGFIDPGFDGTITLELSTDAGVPVRLYPGMKIGQLSLAQLVCPAVRPYGHGAHGSRYQGQEWPTPSRSHDGFTAGLPAVVTT